MGDCWIVDDRETTDSGWVRVHVGRLHVSESPKLVPVSSGTDAANLLAESLPLFGLETANPDDFVVTEIIMHKGGNHQPNLTKVPRYFGISEVLSKV